MKKILLTLAVFAFATNAFAWGQAGHYLTNEAAALALPPDMPQFFLRAFPEIVALAPHADRLLHNGPSSDAAFTPDHFLNYEMVSDLDLTPDRYEYLALLESSRRLAHLGVENTVIGFLPWRIAELSEQLTADFRLWRSYLPGTPDRRAMEQEIVDTAGMLGHFVGDSAQPLHNTMNYNGWVSPNPNGYSNDCTIHARFETDFVSHSIVLADVTPKVAMTPVKRTDYFATALDFIKSSNTQVERVYQLDKKNGFSPFGPVNAEAKAFTSDRLALGASLLRDLWWSAWKNSEAPRPTRRAGTT